MKGTILLLEDMPDMARRYANMLTKAEYEVSVARSSQELFPLLERLDPDLMLLDVHLKGSELNGVEVLRALKKNPDFSSEVIVLSSLASRSEVAEAMLLGARNFHDKDAGSFDRDKFLADVAQAVALRHQASHIRELRRNLLDGALVGECRAMKQVKETILKFAESDINVLITGETGVGKGVAAELIHRNSRRSVHPYSAINMQSLPETLMESELFGHRKGAYTGATSDVKGYFERAHQGTLFLDEVASLNLTNQAKILTVIEDWRIPVLGGGEQQKVNARLISATNRDLPQLVIRGEFRDDLYFRLAASTLHIPPLRERERDVLLLLEHFFSFEAREKNRLLSLDIPALADTLLDYSWPGNVRELKNLCSNVAALHERIDNTVVLGELREHRQKRGQIFEGLRNSGADRMQALMEEEDYNTAMDTFERQYLEHALKKHHRNIAKASEDMGIDRTTLYKKMKKLNLSIEA